MGEADEAAARVAYRRLPPSLSLIHIFAAGAIGGGILGSLTGDWAGEKLGQAWFGPGEARPETAKAATISTGGIDPAELQQAIINANRAAPLKVDVKVDIDGREVAAAVNEHNARDARRN